MPQPPFSTLPPPPDLLFLAHIFPFLGHFPEAPARFLGGSLSSLLSQDRSYPVRVRASDNPGGTAVGVIWAFQTSLKSADRGC